MLIRYFRLSHFLQQYAIWILVAIISWIPAFLNPSPQITENKSLIFSDFIQIVQGIPYLSALLALILTLLSAFLINHVMQVEDMINRTTLLPSLIFVIFASTIPEMQYLQAIHLSLVFVLLSLLFLFRSYRIEEPFAQLFNAGIFISMAGLFFKPAMLLIIFLFIALLVFRAVKWRDWVIPSLGIITPWLFLFTWALWQGSILETWLRYTATLELTASKFPDFSLYVTLFAIGLIPISLLSLLMLIPKTNEMIISVRRMYWVLFWMTASSFALMNFSTSYYQAILLALAPLSGIIALYIFSMKKYRVFDFFFSMWILSMLVIKLFF